jgi:hypothetical protein
MKTLILSEETFHLLLDALDQSDDGREVLARFEAATPMPPDRELVAMARRGDDAPAAIANARERRDAGRQAERDTRLELERLLHYTHAAGVQPSVLMTWFGYNNSRLFQLLTKERERQETPVS